MTTKEEKLERKKNEAFQLTKKYRNQCNHFGLVNCHFRMYIGKN